MFWHDFCTKLVMTLTIKSALALAAFVAPAFASAIPMTWTYSGICTGGDCDVIPTVAGTLHGDPAVLPPFNQLDEPLFSAGDLTSYSFSIGSLVLSGTGATAWGSYELDAGGNIVGGEMLFGELFQLRFLGVGSATWAFVNGLTADNAAGTGGYTTSGPVPTAVPEPGALSLLGLGLLVLGVAVRRRMGSAR
jgi:hypothetical protein